MLTVLAVTSAVAGPPTLLTTVLPADCVGGVDIEPPCGESLVYEPDVVESETLVVFMPGSSMIPADHDHVIQMAGWAGYRVIGLSYNSDRTVGSICADRRCSEDCHSLVRQERILGTDHTSALLDHPVVGSWKEGVIPRLWEAVDAAAAADPYDLSWATYYNASKANPRARPADIHWENIILAGFSQGGGNAIYISQLEQVDGIVLTEGGNDECQQRKGGKSFAAPWYDPTGGASAGQPVFAFGHRRIGSGGPSIPKGLAEIGFTLGDDVDTPGWTLTDRLLAHTNQVHAPGDPAMAKPCTEHTSMGRSDCMPTDATSGLESVLPEDTHLFDAYVEAFELAGQ